ncbi:hypothetical protein C1861_09695 [Eggerthella lenta]|nr:hypothetical protein C1861_09695 [Eggerthella lenta]
MTRSLPNSMLFRHSLPYRLLNQDRLRRRTLLPLSGGWRSGGTSACPMAEEGFRAAGELSRGGPTRAMSILV